MSKDDGATRETQRAEDAWRAVALLGVDPVGLGGVVLRAAPGPVRDLWLELLDELAPARGGVKRVPPGITDDRLIGGLDLAATLSSGRPVFEQGLLAQANDGRLILPMAERIEPRVAAAIASALDLGEVVVEREGFTQRTATRFAVIALDESLADEPPTPGVLRERLAFDIDLEGMQISDMARSPFAASDLVSARARLARVSVDDDAISALCAAADALGVASARATIFALRTACASAALAGRNAIAHEDAEIAARLVLAPRATRLPTHDEAAEEEEAPPPEPPPDEENADAEPHSELDVDALQEIVVAAAQAALPERLLAELAALARPGARTRTGRFGAQSTGGVRGAPLGARPGRLRGVQPLNIAATLRAAAPWQRMRTPSPRQKDCAVIVRPEDARVTPRKRRARALSIFVVDASGSSALNRLAEIKGAVELTLAECYVRRDEVALIAFRGAGAELILAPTRSIARARRVLAGLPGGGGTPLAAGIDAAVALVATERRKGRAPTIALLTDGRANIARNGGADRAQAEADALEAAGLAALAGAPAVVIDTSPRPQPFAQMLATRMNARYEPLPSVDAHRIAGVMSSASAK